VLKAPADKTTSLLAIAAYLVASGGSWISGVGVLSYSITTNPQVGPAANSTPTTPGIVALFSISLVAVVERRLSRFALLETPLE
jgi:hypothetical protein